MSHAAEPSNEADDRRRGLRRERPALPVWAAAALIVGAGLLAHANALDGFLFHDDILSIVDDPHTRVAWPLSEAAWADYESPMAARPVPSLSRSLNYALGGFDAYGYKALNLALHLGCALLLFGLVRRTLELPVLAPRFGAHALPLAASTALLWVLHPLTSECVAYVTQRTESWMALFYLATLYATARALAGDGKHWRPLAVASCFLGMASKESMVTAPVLVFAFEWAYAGGEARGILRRHGAFYASLASSWLLLAGLMIANGRGGTVGGDLGVSPLTYLWNQAWVIPRYLRLVVWPSGLAFDWGVPRAIGFAAAWPGVLALGAAFAGSVALTFRRPATGLPLLALFILLSPTSSFVPIVTEVGAERRMYLPLAFLLAWSLCALAHRLGVLDPAASRARQRAPVAAVLALAVALGSVTWLRIEEYRSEFTLWSSQVARFPDVGRTYHGLGRVQRDRGDLQKAEASFRRCIELDPEDAHCHSELGVTMLALGRDRRQAARHLERAAAIGRTTEALLYNWAVFLAEEGRIEEAVPVLRAVLRADPDHAGAAARLALWLVSGDDPDASRLARARGLATRAVASGARPSLALRAMAAVAAAEGRFDEAAQWAQRAVTHPDGLASEREEAKRDLARYRSRTRGSRLRP